MSRSKGSTIFHNTSYRPQIDRMLKDKTPKEGFAKYRDKINETTDIEVSIRQVRYYYNRYLRPHIAVNPKEVDDKIKERTDLIDVLTEKIELYHLQKKRVMRMDKKEREVEKRLSALRLEIETAMEMLRECEATMQDLGIMNRSAEKLEVNESKNINLENLSETTVDKLVDSFINRHEAENHAD